jgi:hypothetical protein
VYLRGLDGQTVGNESAGREAGDETPRRNPLMPTSIEELHWSPDINKAEGQAQFDYLGRLGDQVHELQSKLRREGDHRVRAIGIVGSDVYDTLLILQALRQRFPNVLFFTTDLDVRFLHPHERAWARNLIVVSSYGLALHRSLQATAAPFRDSTQTAQFAAVMAALGAEGMSGLTKIPPRRFEIGNGRAVDLSVAANDPLLESSEAAGAPPEPEERRYLHPLTISALEQSLSERVSRRTIWGMVAIAILILGASRAWVPLRRLTWEGWTYPARALEYSDEDIGGPDGAGAMLGWLPRQSGHPVADWLLHDARIADLQDELEKLSPGTSGALEWEREALLGAASGRIVTRLNQCFADVKSGGEALERIVSEASTGKGWRQRVVDLWPPARRMARYHAVRRCIDEFLDEIESTRLITDGNGSVAHRQRLLATATATRSPMPAMPVVSWALDVVFGTTPPTKITAPETTEDPEAAALRSGLAARESAEAIYHLRRRRLACFWLGVLVFGVAACGLTAAIWWDTYERANGEPFSLTSGTSAWPAQIVRLVVVVLAVCFGVGLSNKLRESFFALTRAFRFAPPSSDRGAATDSGRAEIIWYQYREGSHFRCRLLRISGALGLYFLGLMAIFSAQGEPAFHPIRGDVITILNRFLILGSVLGFLLLAFLTIDASRLCRSFIEKISARPTQYPEATRRHFSRQMGKIDVEYLDEWIDLQLIAELTEKVGRLVYYPAGLSLLLLLARNSWWDAWSWPESLIAIFALNFVLALTSVVILQRAARDAKHKAEQSLTTKVKKLHAQTARSSAENNAAQAEKLLEEIRQLRRGAFVPFWENPVVGAVFLSSGGTTMLQVFIWFMSR